MSEHRVFALEGMDGSGKTTVGRMLAEQTKGAYFYCTQSSSLRPLRGYFDDKPLPVRFMYYLALVMENYPRVERLRKTSDVFYDRTLASTIAYHRAYGLSETWFKLVPPFLSRQLDLMVYFDLGKEERKRRLGKRQVQTGVMNRNDNRSIEFDEIIYSEYQRVMPDRTLIVSTENKSPQQVTDEVRYKLYEIKR